MIIEELFIELGKESKKKNTDEIFEKSGMINKYQKLSYGFFPLGNGILPKNPNEQKKQLIECKIMILGNDFGTEDYLVNKCKEDKESPSNPTIKNIFNGLMVDSSSTFFTNFHLGVRKDGKNTKRVVTLKNDYKQFCFDFFATQIKFINPQIVICLGHEVRQALAEHEDLFSSWKGKSTTFKKLYSQKHHEINIANEELGKRKFIVIPHPCDTRNFSIEYINQILPSIQN